MTDIDIIHPDEVRKLCEAQGRRIFAIHNSLIFIEASSKNSILISGKNEYLFFGYTWIQADNRYVLVETVQQIPDPWKAVSIRDLPIEIDTWEEYVKLRKLL